MQRVNYDEVAPAYDRRYERTRYDGVREALRRFVGGAEASVVGEVGCGTGHWLADLSQRGISRVVGIDLSLQMLRLARSAAPEARLVQGTATQLPLIDRSVDRLFCVNALHHFPDQRAFIGECGRVLRSGGGLLTIGLDPHRGLDRWWVYDAYPAAQTADRLRYSSAATIREWLRDAGFRQPATEVAQVISTEIPFDVAREQGLVDRRAASQLMVISDDEFESGMTRLLKEQPVLRSRVRLYATTAWI